MSSPSTADRPVRLLCVGDVHLGLPAKRLPAGLDDFGLRPADLGPAAALARVVELARSEGVDAVLLAGDVVESDNELFEAYAPLRASAQGLAAAGVPLLAVVGNHDTHVLPRLARELPSVRLVGLGGRWEAVPIERDGVPRARVIGWSFPQPNVSESPLLSFPAAWRSGDFEDGAPPHLPALGLLHCDLDVSPSRHAPVRRSELVATGLAFALGHIHRPDALDGRRPVGYLGCLSGVDPGEAGARGPWLFEATPEGWRAEHLPIAPLRYERVAVTVEGAADVQDLRERWLRALPRTVETLLEPARTRPELTSHPVRAAALRVMFEGRRPRHLPVSVLESLGRELVAAPPQLIDGVALFVEAWRDTTRPALELEALARGDDPAGLLARRVLALESPGEARDQLLARARPELTLALARHALEEQDLPASDEALAEHLAASGRRLLETLLVARREEGA